MTLVHGASVSPQVAAQHIETQYATAIKVWEDSNEDGWPYGPGERTLPGIEVCVQQPPYYGPTNCLETNETGHAVFDLANEEFLAWVEVPQAWYPTTPEEFITTPGGENRWFGLNTKRTYLPIVLRGN